MHRGLQHLLLAVGQGDHMGAGGLSEPDRKKESPDPASLLRLAGNPAAQVSPQ